MIIKEFCCIHHGYFEGSHPICPKLGCESEYVDRVFLTPPGIKSARTKNTDAGLQQIADDYHLTDMSNRGGESVMSQQDRNPHTPIWGKQGVKNFDSMLQQASTPTVVRDSQGREHVADHMGMRAAAKAFGVDQRVLPPAERTYLKNDTEDRMRVMK